jgi:cell division septation protein DedD
VAEFVCEEFKSQMRAVRNELERLERERAKNLPQPPPVEVPPVPAPSIETPRPAPSKAPATSGAPLTPTQGIVHPLSNQGAVLTPIRSPGETGEAVPTPQFPGSLNTQPITEPTPAQSGDVVETKPAYALSFAHKPAAPVAPARNVIARLAQAGLKRLWAVQVAALSEKKDAEAIANTLRKSGYDAYVVTIQLGEKTWHRVRVGQLADTKAAGELKNTLVSATPFKQAYVAVK